MAAADLVTGVVIVRQRCASTEPPADSDARMTNIGVAYYVRDHRGEAWFYIEDDHATMPCDPQPRVWFGFPRDTERETLTVMALKRLYNAACHKHERASIGDLISLGAALDALDTER